MCYHRTLSALKTANSYQSATRLPNSDQRIITAFFRQSFHKRIHTALVRRQFVITGADR